MRCVVHAGNEKSWLAINAQQVAWMIPVPVTDLPQADLNSSAHNLPTGNAGNSYLDDVIRRSAMASTSRLLSGVHPPVAHFSFLEVM